MDIRDAVAMPFQQGGDGKKRTAILTATGRGIHQDRLAGRSGHAPVAPHGCVPGQRAQIVAMSYCSASASCRLPANPPDFSPAVSSNGWPWPVRSPPTPKF